MVVGFSLAALSLVALITRSAADCNHGFGPGDEYPNVGWAVKDSITACPAGDSVITIGSAFPLNHPSRLRVLVNYFDSNCNPRVGVPPESLKITWTALAGGNARINDKSSLGTYADDATDGNGQARFTFPSLSGCGKLRLSLNVSGSPEGTRDVLVRTVDPDIDLERRVTTLEQPLACDYNWNGLGWDDGDNNDLEIFDAHVDHWRRNALHGSLVSRTNLPATGNNRIGDSEISWSPNGRWLAYTVHVGGPCKIFLVQSTPTSGIDPGKFTFTPAGDHDYDPSWSPLGHEIVFNRGDNTILRKGVPGVAADTSEIFISSSGPGGGADGDVTPTISPNGQTVAFARRNQEFGYFNIWKIPIGGGTATQVTFGTETALNEQYPQWSPDGVWITFDRQNAYPDEHRIWKVKANGDSLQEVVFAGTGNNAASPAFSPDGRIITAGIGVQHAVTVDNRTHTIDPLLVVRKPILNYPEPQHAIAGVDPILSPRISPDGTRLAIRAEQIHAVRRSMNLPPKFTQIGSQSVHDTTAMVSFNVIQGQNLTIVLTATDADDATRTYFHAFDENFAGVSWVSATRTWKWTSAGPVGVYFVKFWVTNGSVVGGSQNGAMDAIVAKITVTSSAPQRSVGQFAIVPDSDGRGFSANLPEGSAATAQLKIFDVSGRLVVSVGPVRGAKLHWDGHSRNGRRVAPGIYLYRAAIGTEHYRGKIVLR